MSLPLADRVRDRRVPEVVQAHRVGQPGPLGVAAEHSRNHPRTQRPTYRTQHAVTATLALDRRKDRGVLSPIHRCRVQLLKRRLRAVEDRYQPLACFGLRGELLAVLVVALSSGSS